MPIFLLIWNSLPKRIVESPSQDLTKDIAAACTLNSYTRPIASASEVMTARCCRNLLLGLLLLLLLLVLILTVNNRACA